MSDTPETNAFKRTVGVPWWEFAGQLERERDEARKLLREANRGAERNAHVNRLLAQHLNESAQKFQTAEAELIISNGERDAFRRENAEMREVINGVSRILCSISLNDIFEDTMRNHAILALSKLQPFLKP
jgi:hypothetical protein